jgi:glutamate synthase (NADPH/NADH) small chain
MEKWLIDRRVEQMGIEGVEFITNVNVGVDIPVKELLDKNDALILAGGSEKARDIKIPGRELKGIHFAMEFLPQQNRVNAGIKIPDQILAAGKNVVVLGGGDTGSDCIGTCSRQGAKSVTQLEILPQPPKDRAYNTPWPFWPMMLRTSSSQEEGAVRKWAVNTKEFIGDDKGNVIALKCNEVSFENNKFVDIPGTEFEISAELVLIAAGFVHPVHEGLLNELKDMGLELDNRGNVKAEFGNNDNSHQTNLKKVFACGDMRRGQSLIVWAIAEGRQCAASVHKALMSEVEAGEIAA